MYSIRKAFKSAITDLGIGTGSAPVWYIDRVPEQSEQFRFMINIIKVISFKITDNHRHPSAWDYPAIRQNRQHRTAGGAPVRVLVKSTAVIKHKLQSPSHSDPGPAEKLSHELFPALVNQA